MADLEKTTPVEFQLIITEPTGAVSVSVFGEFKEAIDFVLHATVKIFSFTITAKLKVDNEEHI